MYNDYITRLARRAIKEVFILSTADIIKAPFSAEEVKCRVGRVFPDGQAGVLFLYVDARVCQDRLDEICGITGWSTAFRLEHTKEGAVVLCELTANIDGKLVKREDCSELTDLSDAKGAASTAFKRACAALGIGRYLYNVGEIKVKLVNKFFRGKVLLPDQLLPENERQGRKKIEVVYDETPSYNTTPTAPSSNVDCPPELKEAFEFVVETGFFKGKPMKNVSVKGLGWLKFNGSSQAEKDAADSVYKFLSNKQAQNTNAEVDVPF